MSRIHIVQVTDCHLQQTESDTYNGENTEQRFESVIAKLAHYEHPIDLLLLTGDLAHHGYPEAYTRLIEKTQSIARQVIWLPGNHDAWLQMRQYPLLYQQEWSLPGSSWVLMTLNSIYNADGRGSGSIGVEQASWLNHRLSQHTAHGKNVLITLHHPPIPVGSEWQDAIMLGDADVLLDIVKRYDSVKGIICGHLHQQHDLKVNDVPVWVTPATAPQYQVGTKVPMLEIDTVLAQPGYRLFTLQEDGTLTTEVVRVEVDLERTDKLR